MTIGEHFKWFGREGAWARDSQTSFPKQFNYSLPTNA